MPKLNDILDEISAMLEVPDEELSDEQKAAMDAYLDELAGQEADKVDAIGQFFRLEAARAEALKTEANRLASRARTAQNRMAWLKEKYLHHMKQAGVNKLKGAVYSMSIRTTDVVSIINQDALPEQFIRVKTTVDPDKVALKAALKEGQEIPGAALSQSFSLQVA